jgi:hypothetical protein
MLYLNVIWLLEIPVTTELIKEIVLNHNFKATKSIINPPYGMKDKKNWDSVLKQLDSLEENGECCAIIPIGKLSNNTTNNKYKEKNIRISEC